MEARLLNGPGLEVLASDVSASVDLHVLRSGSLASPAEGVIDTRADEDVRGAAPRDDRLGRPTGHHEDRGAAAWPI
jgi:hypothetical protein